MKSISKVPQPDSFRFKPTHLNFKSNLHLQPFKLFELTGSKCCAFSLQRISIK